jgi:hypothetical protein
MDPLDSTRGLLLEMLSGLRSQEITSADQLRELRWRDFAAASDVVAGAGVDQAEGLALLTDHATAVDSLLRERWPSMFESILGNLTFEDRPMSSRLSMRPKTWRDRMP